MFNCPQLTAADALDESLKDRHEEVIVINAEVAARLGRKTGQLMAFSRVQGKGFFNKDMYARTQTLGGCSGMGGWWEQDVNHIRPGRGEKGFEIVEDLRDSVIGSKGFCLGTVDVTDGNDLKTRQEPEGSHVGGSNSPCAEECNFEFGLPWRIHYGVINLKPVGQVETLTIVTSMEIASQSECLAG